MEIFKNIKNMPAMQAKKAVVLRRRASERIGYEVEVDTVN